MSSLCPSLARRFMLLLETTDRGRGLEGLGEGGAGEEVGGEKGDGAPGDFWEGDRGRVVASLPPLVSS
jgi:hypothetical protein